MKKIITLITTLLLFIAILNFYQTGRCQELIENLIYVGGIGPGNYSTIQSALENASIGDTIFVCNGIYYENVEVNKTVNIIGENKENTIINGRNNRVNDSFSIVIYISADQVNISGFTITNNILEYNLTESTIFGVGILVKANKTSIQENIIKENTFGISLDNTFYNRIITNTFTDNNIHVNLLGSSENNIENCQITNQEPNMSFKLNEEFGIYLDIANHNTIVNNTISNISGVGVELTNLCENNSIYYNNFINNTENANDSGRNTWDNSQYGNYWDDYKESDKNNDGVGDIPFNIPNGNNKDRYPLMMPYDGTFSLKEFYVDLSSVITMLVLGMILVIVFLIPIAYFWNKKNKY